MPLSSNGRVKVLILSNMWCQNAYRCTFLHSNLAKSLGTASCATGKRKQNCEDEAKIPPLQNTRVGTLCPEKTHRFLFSKINLQKRRHLWLFLRDRIHKATQTPPKIDIFQTGTSRPFDGVSCPFENKFFFSFMIMQIIFNGDKVPVCFCMHFYPLSSVTSGVDLCSLNTRHIEGPKKSHQRQAREANLNNVFHKVFKNADTGILHIAMP